LSLVANYPLKPADICLEQIRNYYDENVAIPIREKMNLSEAKIERRVMTRIEQAELGEAGPKNIPRRSREVCKREWHWREPYCCRLFPA